MPARVQEQARVRVPAEPAGRALAGQELAGRAPAGQEQARVRRT